MWTYGWNLRLIEYYLSILNYHYHDKHRIVNNLVPIINSVLLKVCKLHRA